MYEQKKRDKALKSKTSKIVVKEIRFGPQTDEHDYQFKKKHAEKFLKEGAKLKAFVFFKGRSIIFKEQGQILLLRLAQDLEEIGTDALGIPEDELPADISGSDGDIVAAALANQGFKNIAGDDIQKYVKAIKPGGYRGSHKKHGKAPWSGDLFTGDGMSPTKQITVKESVDLARWQKLAGILKD